MLTVDFKKKLGEFTVVELHDDGEHLFKIGIYACNALAAFVNMYKSSYDNKRHAMLYAFFGDKSHIRNIEKEYDNTRPFFPIRGAVKLNMACKECETLLAFFARQGHTIKPYYKPLKTK